MTKFSFIVTTIIAMFILFYSSIEVLGQACSFSVKMKQLLENEGFHRNITYDIVFSNEAKTDKWMKQDCIIALDQKLPSGVYANPDELGDFRRSNKLNAIPKNRINIELPTEQSEPSSVYIVGMVAENKVSTWLPVHARYHQAVTGGGNARNEITPPKLYLRCPDQKLEYCGKTISSSVTFLCNGSPRGKCSWKELPFTQMTDTLIWEVPVGNLKHYYPVAIVTSLVVVIGSLYLLKAIHEYKIENKKKKL